MPGECMYCGVEMHDFSPRAVYCIDCYGKYGEWECNCTDEEGECFCPPPEAFKRDQAELARQQSRH